MDWLNENLKKKIKDEFRKDYKRELTNEEVKTIAINLTEFMESYIKFKFKQKYENFKK